MSIADTVVMFAALTGFHYNLTNIYSGMVEAKDKMYARMASSDRISLNTLANSFDILNLLA